MTAKKDRPSRLDPRAPVFRPSWLTGLANERVDQAELRGGEEESWDEITPDDDDVQTLGLESLTLQQDQAEDPVFLTKKQIKEQIKLLKKKKRRKMITEEEVAVLEAYEDEKFIRKRLIRAQKEDKEARHMCCVFMAAKATITILRQCGIRCAVFGSFACKLYGDFRYPNDVDFLITQPIHAPFIDAEQVKRLIVENDPSHFYLKLPRDPHAPYRILHYRLDSGLQHCKVDILLPGTIYLPNLLEPSRNTQITVIEGIPLVPFSLLLLHKLQGWADHEVSNEAHKRRKRVQDAADVRRLLAMDKWVRVLRETRPWKDKNLFCEEFQELTKVRVKAYCARFPKRRRPWEELGLIAS
ncbi:hypothetical protein NP233_g9609 [Leucocoprinus birnbaumii]|uniref:Uncharacterized protein n=1 Tax=Leucocoprinus birnbaumii TaxID=56174 RepID=A0AAD5YN10_9AGAR|nr:hypothetical protein NP233_g9609 [Leucocoprinus birnbaumii]